MDPLPSRSNSGRPSTDGASDPVRLSYSYSGAGSDGGSGSQSLSSILNNPLGGRSGVYGSDGSWGIWWPSSSAVPPDPSFAAIPNKAVAALPDVTRADFQAYLSSISESFARFEDVRTHSSRETATDPAEIRGQGEALVACLREVPSLYFKEDFALEEGATFKAACPFTSALETGPLQEKLSHYLDTVEMHLVREIGLRSDSFFEAQGRLQGLDGEIVEACGRIRELKETIRLLDADLVGSARRVQELNATRASLVALQQKLTLILYVSQALSALQLLISAADCAGALDVTDDLQQLLDGDELAGLHCFRHLRDKLTMSLDAINSILSAEFMRASIHDAKNVDSAILSKLKSKTNNLSNGQSNEEMLDDEESTILRDRLLPLIIGLLRTAKFPAVLRIYRDALISDMKAAIKSTVAELLPVLVSWPLEFDITGGERAIDADGGGLSLANKLRSLSSESFVQLLIAIYMVVQAHLLRAAEVKRVIEWIMGNLDGCYAADAVAAAVTQGSAAASTAETIQENDGQLTSHLLYSLPKNASKVSSLHGKTNEVSSPNLSKNFRTDILRENTEAVFAACDTAHGRWAKLLGVRALLHPKLRLQEFLSIYNITQEFITATEKIGGRLGYSIRGTLQSQSKAFIDFQHESRMTKIRAVLDQETWVAVDVPDEFQGIAALLYSEALYNENLDAPGDPTSRYSDNDPAALSAQQAPRTNDSVGTSREHATLDTASSGKNRENKAEVLPSSTQSNNVNDHGKSNPRMLSYRGVGYHMVNCGLILLKMLSEYVDISKSLPSLSSEVVHRVVEILKLFNTRTCQLVLGAGAMQVSGLKSITSKHLALASQVISFIYAIIPDIRHIIFQKLPDSRKALLQSEIDRVAQDFRIHRDEIHSKLVQIMRERLLAHIRELPKIVESWNRIDDSDPQPSSFAKSITKEVTFLHRVLSKILLEIDVQTIFRQVVQLFHLHISEAFANLEITTPQAEKRLYQDIQHILQCVRALPSDNFSRDGVPNYGQLDDFLAQRLGEKKTVTLN
ncbi:hypothetical protein QJS04_geneDACA000203 [Acorus gramineus]|uniref:Vacuolar protein sorting-associated protein 54 C-terminal domain-containing protein n=1 Tax=Acorus gramineus TaxID=55184 RepID=A0AAV9AQM6_ACOGR|nr:hypothetical protein QJS04_geneDACA000203 [Acorus gramineus]